MLNKLFGGIRMTWKRLIVFAVISGVITGLIALLVPDNNSVHQIAVTLEAWIVLAISTVLNTVYFMRTVLTIYRPVDAENRKPHGIMPSGIETAATIGMILVNIALGVASQPIVRMLEAGLDMFG